MRKISFGLLFVCCGALANTASDPMAFIKDKPYTQVVKDMVLARCIAQVSQPNSDFSLDAARSANALREWIPFDIENGNEKVNALISQFKTIPNKFHTESAQPVKGVTLNCLRLYHSPELDKLANEVLVKDADHTWYQDHPDQLSRANN